jgi:drug/metabolite transporter (DMT)-like permease
VLPASLTAICFALTAVSARQSATLIGPLRANFFRLLLAMLILGCIALLSWRGMPRSVLWEFALAGGIGFGLGGFCMMQALKCLGSPRALLAVESATAVLAGLFAWVALDDTLTPQQILSCAIILGAVLYAGSAWIREEPMARRNSIYGYTLAGAAALFQATSLVLSRHAFLEARGLGVPVDMFNAAFIRLCGGLSIALLLIMANVIRQGGRISLHPVGLSQLWVRKATFKQQPFVWVTANALFGPVLGVTCWLWAVSLLNPGIVQSIAATAPLISIPVSRCLESHPLGTRFYVGAPVAILGITLLMLW